MTIAELLDRGAELRWQAISGGLLRLSELMIVIDPKVHDSPRHLAACAEDVSAIRIAPQLALEPSPIIDGILMHELGHAADFAYPGSWIYDVRGRLFVGAHAKPHHRRAWKRRDPYKVETDADALAEAIFNVRIGYVGDRMLQSTEGGIRPRPFGL
jgi:hypothetical protein